MAEHAISMKPTPPTLVTAADLPALRALLAVDRPLHWDLARAMLRTLERTLGDRSALAAPRTVDAAAGPSGESGVAVGEERR